MSDSDNDNTDGLAHSMTRKDNIDDISSDDDDDDDDDDNDDVGVDSLRDLLHGKAFTDDVSRKREERLALEAKKRGGLVRVCPTEDVAATREMERRPSSVAASRTA
ncbi:hypothetical protein POJ06DRAFT_116603 [Lipomyces tetrasporus]|uniref:Uncharacterized protein n=1 Tax=Lipomyces tetrasporus TaxID=54092 RepID=A0AAD7QRU2_9ASCO|nr:uncharacterized protein POJ06DRAFT_116603 [Lipomyces tetrasporus]KAJ8099786.1 hypothetical protein POJ06DRAFT_116603 [Lipomyces tetrasporus]